MSLAPKHNGSQTSKISRQGMKSETHLQTHAAENLFLTLLRSASTCAHVCVRRHTHRRMKRKPKLHD